MSKKPKVFIGSSSEDLEIAYAIQTSLEHCAECTVWNQNFFNPTSFTLDDLLTQTRNFDFGIFVFNNTDLLKTRRQQKATVRDNVVFELGIFLGIFGKERCFIIAPKSSKGFHIPSDLAGINILFYEDDREDQNTLAAVGPKVNRISGVIQKHNGEQFNKSHGNLPDKLVQQITNISLTAFYSSRDDYIKYREGEPSIDKYIAKAQNTITLVSISLTTGITFDSICNVLKEKVIQNKNFKIRISLLNPYKDELYETISPIFEQTASTLKNNTKETFKRLLKLKSELNKAASRRIEIFAHNSLPFGSAIILDGDCDNGTIQIETKPYKAGIRNSFAFEISNKSDFYNILKNSYDLLINDGLSQDDILYKIKMEEST